MPLPIDLVLVRHGESEGNVALHRSEEGDHSLFDAAFKARHSSLYRLSDAGRTQAAACGDWLRGNGLSHFDRYFVSGYVRAMETAGLLALPTAEWYVDMNLRERDWGDMDVASENEKQTVYADVMQRKIRDGALLWCPPNGERLLTVRNRVGIFLDRLHRESFDQKVVVVCHGEVMWVFRMVLERLTAERFYELEASEEPKDRIHNCQILHYSRRNPDPSDGRRQEDSIRWMRSVCPWDASRSTNDWQRIVRPLFSNAQLLELVEATPRLINAKK